MYNLNVFDLDNTLAPVGKPVPEGAVKKLRELEKRGGLAALCSGKSADYLCGFARQLGLHRPVIIGNNGAVVQLGIDLPPTEFHVLPFPDEAQRAIDDLRARITARLPNIWFQANLVGLTPFPVTEREFDTVTRCIEETGAGLEYLDVYRHADSFDIVPRGIDKGTGLGFAARLLGVSKEQTAAVGDGPNDMPMFAAAGLSIGIGLYDGVDIGFETIDEALEYLLNT